MLLTLTRLLAFQRRLGNAVKAHQSAADTLAADKAELALLYEETKHNTR